VKFDDTLFKAELIRRYKRFLADVRCADGSVLTVHCPNTGAMTGCDVAGSEVWCSVSPRVSRKYACTLEVVCVGGHRVVVNTAIANIVVVEALQQGAVPEFGDYSVLKTEVLSPRGSSRFDLCLSGGEASACYVEVKSMTLLGEDGVGYFPDARSERARKHVEELGALTREGYRAALIFCVQHTGIRRASIAEWIDPDYAKAIRQAMRSGMEVFALASNVSEEGVWACGRLPFLIQGLRE
jgi:sugar fermentation stimulation protein A